MEKNLKITLICITFIYSLILLSCLKVDHKIEDVYRKKYIVSFVQARSQSSGLESPNYGDVMIFDIDNDVFANITEDSFFDFDPSWSPFGDKLLFQSSRAEKQLSLDIAGINGPHNVFYYDFNSYVLQKVEIPYEKDRPKYLKNTLKDLQWYSGDLSFVFRYAGDNKIFRSFIQLDTTIVFKEFVKFKKIKVLKVCFLTKAIAFEYEGTVDDPNAFGIAFIDSTATEVKQISESEVYLGGWSNNGESILYIQDSLIIEYNLRLGSKDVVLNSEKEFIVDRPYYVDDRRIAFLARYKENSHELFIYNKESKILKKITNNGLEKKWLSVRISKQ